MSDGIKMWQAQLPDSIIEALRERRRLLRVRQRELAKPAMSMWVLEVERPSAVLAMPDGTEVAKEAGHPFPPLPEGASLRTGRPDPDELRERTEPLRNTTFRLPKDLSDRCERAMYWRWAIPAYDIEDAFRLYLGI